MDTKTDDTIAVVDAYPDCDVHKQVFGVSGVPAAYDAPLKANGAGAYLCQTCWPKWSTGRLGLGLGQRLVLAGES